ncbi:MAG: hypothetical protein GY940_45150, partial [bacterium]|nr:hypothetical protein [bacterium]
LTIFLSMNREREKYTIEELVYKCFGGPMPRDAIVEHINGNPCDNRFKNLRLSRTRKKSPPLPTSQNDANGSGPARVTPGKRWKGKEVLQFNSSGAYLKKFPSINDAAASVNMSPSSISACTRKEINTAGGFQWFYKKDPLFANGIRNVTAVNLRYKEVLQFSLEGKFLRPFQSITQAINKTKITRCSIQDNLGEKSTEAHGFQFRYRKDPFFRFGIRDIPAVAPKSNRNPRARIVLQFDLYGHFVVEHSSITEAARSCGRASANIGACLNGKRQS